MLKRVVVPLFPSERSIKRCFYFLVLLDTIYSVIILAAFFAVERCAVNVTRLVQPVHLLSRQHLTIKKRLQFAAHNDIMNNEVVLLGAAGAAQVNTTFSIGPLQLHHKEVAMHAMIPCPDLVRSIPRHFAWIDRGLRDPRFLGRMSFKEQALYSFLVLAADKNGISFYRSEKIAVCFDYQIHPMEIRKCRDDLIERKLIAFSPFPGSYDEGFHQVLPLPVPRQLEPPIHVEQRGGEFTPIADVLKNLTPSYKG